MRVALAQLNPLVGDLAGNSKKILAACKNANSLESNLILTPELSLWGYPPKDLLLNSSLLELQEKVLNEIVRTIKKELSNLNLLIGIAEKASDCQLPNLFNSIALINKTGWEVVARKRLLPFYDVFDENRYFRPDKTSSTFTYAINNNQWNLGITICEDLWVEEELQGNRLNGPDPIEDLISQKIDLLINLSASPFSKNKESLRHKLAAKAAQRLNCPVIYLNQVGGNDELIFDGASFAVNPNGHVSLKLLSCNEDIKIWDSSSQIQKAAYFNPCHEEKLFEALVLGVSDYAEKCNFNSALIGLSGGIDSSLVAVIASAALGAKKVVGVLMPSPWTSTSSTIDAMNLAEKLGITTHTVPITKLMDCFHSSLTGALNAEPQGVTAENLQSRIRGTILMALSNEKGHLLLSTGNKSELAVGYCTLYGDMNGGLSVIGDLYKTYVFKLCRWLDSKHSQRCREKMGLCNLEPLIGEAIISKSPSAELRPGQLDSDSLPNYELLDPILKGLIEKRYTPKDLINNGHNPELISKVQILLRKSEFKRRQAPPVLKVSDQAFGSGWRLPIATI